MKRLLIGFLVVSGLVTLLSFANTSSPVSSSDQKVFKEQLLNAVGPLPSKWDNLTFDEIGHRSIRLTLLYRDSPRSMEQVKHDAHRIARAVLKV